MTVHGFVRPVTCVCGHTANYTAAIQKHRATCKQAAALRWTAEDRRQVKQGDR